MEVRVYWDDKQYGCYFCDQVVYKHDYKSLVLYIGKDTRSFYLPDVKKVIMKGD